VGCYISKRDFENAVKEDKAGSAHNPRAWKEEKRVLQRFDVCSNEL